MYDYLGGKGEGYCDERLRYLRDQPPTGWNDPHARMLASRHDPDCKNIYEIRFKANGVQQRPMGYFGPRNNEFTIVLWATHKDDKWDPSNFCELAKRRWKLVTDGGETREIEID